MFKEILRKKFIKLRNTNFNKQNISLARFNKILNKLNHKKNINIGGYYPINSEIECLDILEKLEKKNFGISLPVIKNNNNMEFYAWSFQNALKIGKFGIPEPDTIKLVFPDVLIVPLVGYDHNKFRLGYGGGFYDRYINRLSKFKNVLTIGFAFSFQKIKKIPINKFDQKLDIILTNKGIIK